MRLLGVLGTAILAMGRTFVIQKIFRAYPPKVF